MAQTYQPLKRGKTAAELWAQLDGKRTGLMSRCENYASLTVPKLCLPDGFQPDTTDQAHDWQSFGAQAVNHVTNKVMFALFNPSRPWMLLEPGKTSAAELEQAGVPKEDVAAGLAQIERNAVRALDRSAQRPKLYTAIRHLIVTGNVLLDLSDNEARVMGLRYYCVKRTLKGKIHTLVIRENILFDELSPEVQEACVDKRVDENTTVSYYKLVQRQPTGDYTVTQWIDERQLDPSKFSGKYPEDELPYHALTWDLADESDYGTGLIEEYAGDLQALSNISEAWTGGVILGMEFRWLVAQTGMTSADDLNKSSNGDALPGTPADVAPVQAGNPQAVAVAQQGLEHLEQRLARGFLLLSALTRDAERVTAEEIRLTAQELETAYGGVYSNLALTLQLPVSKWLLRRIDADIKGTDIELSVITGLDALSRQADLESLVRALDILGRVTALPPALQARLKFDALTKHVGMGSGIDLAPFLKSDNEVAQDQAQAIEQQAVGTTLNAAGEAAAQGLAPQ